MKLCKEEKYLIKYYIKIGFSQRDVADLIDRHNSTICRFLQKQKLFLIRKIWHFFFPHGCWVNRLLDKIRNFLIMIVKI